MKVLERMAKLSTCEDFLEFFEIPYDKKLLNSKRLFILKKFSHALEKAAELEDEDEKYNRLKWSLLTIYGEFAKGYNPSAADIWGESSCASCSDSTACA